MTQSTSEFKFPVSKGIVLPTSARSLHSVWIVKNYTYISLHRVGYSPQGRKELDTTERLYFESSLVAQMVKHLPVMWETWVRSLGWEDLLEKEMATHSSTLAWRIPRTEEPGRLQSMGSQRVRYD